jgi:hypothetical protein
VQAVLLGASLGTEMYGASVPGTAASGGAASTSGPRAPCA